MPPPPLADDTVLKNAQGVKVRCFYFQVIELDEEQRVAKLGIMRKNNIKKMFYGKTQFDKEDEELVAILGSFVHLAQMERMLELSKNRVTEFVNDFMFLDVDFEKYGWVTRGAMVLKCRQLNVPPLPAGAPW